MSKRSAMFLPPARLPIVDASGVCNPTWYKFFELLNEATGGDGKIEIEAQFLPNTLVSSSEAISGFELTAGDTQINISAGTRTIDGRTITVNAGVVTGLNPSTSYTIYYRDPDRVGGNQTFLAGTSLTSILSDNSNVIVGTVSTVAAGDAPQTSQPPGPSWQDDVPDGNFIP